MARRNVTTAPDDSLIAEIEVPLTKRSEDTVYFVVRHAIGQLYNVLMSTAEAAPDEDLVITLRRS